MMCASDSNRKNKGKGSWATDEIGRIYGKLSVIKRVEKSSANRGIVYLCRCECGKTVKKKGTILRKGAAKCCGCSRISARFIDETGKNYEHFKVIERVNLDKNPARWKCLCDCGNIFESVGHAIRSGARKRCGRGQCHGAAIGHEKACLGKILASYRHNAKKTGKLISINEDEFHSMFKKNCHYCGKPPSQKVKKSYGGQEIDYSYNGVDRVNSKKGYERGNVVPCCGRCNVAKNSMTQEEFLVMVKNIYEKHIKEAA